MYSKLEYLAKAELPLTVFAAAEWGAGMKSCVETAKRKYIKFSN